MAGSIWPEGAKHLVPGLIELINKNENVNLIICPHEPTPKFVSDFEDKFSEVSKIGYKITYNDWIFKKSGENIVFGDKDDTD